jgi:hypothetical protein
MRKYGRRRKQKKLKRGCEETVMKPAWSRFTYSRRQRYSATPLLTPEQQYKL